MKWITRVLLLMIFNIVLFMKIYWLYQAHIARDTHELIWQLFHIWFWDYFVGSLFKTLREYELD